MSTNKSKAMAVLAALAALLLGAGEAWAEEPATIELVAVQGPVELGRGEPPAWRPAAVGDRIEPGDTLRTGRGGRAEVSLGSGSLRLYENSLVRIPADAVGAHGAEAVELEQGDSLFDVLRERLRREFEVRTPEVVVSVKGTRFGVSLDAELAAVSVFRGSVGVRALAQAIEEEMLVRAGFAAVGGIERAFELVVLPELDPWSDWSAGRTLPVRPEQLLGASLERAAVEQAREAGRHAARAELVKKVAEERPELVREAVQARAEKLRAARLRELKQEALQERREELQQLRPDSIEPLPPLPASLEPAGEPHAGLDPVTDARRLQKQAALRVEQELVEAVVQGAMLTSSTSFNLPFAIQVLAGSTPSKVVISDAGGVLGQLTQADIDQVLQSGDPSLLGGLLPILEQLEIDPLLFTRKLDDLI